jgi:hypothetical protein
MNPISNPHPMLAIAQTRLPRPHLRIPGQTIPHPSGEDALLIGPGVIFALLGIGLALLARSSTQLDHDQTTELDEHTLHTRRRLLLVARYCCYTAAAMLIIVAAALIIATTLLL